MRPDNLDLDLDADVHARLRILKVRDDAPVQLAGQLWTCPVGHRPAGGCSTRWQPPPTFPVGLWLPRRSCVTCSPTRCCCRTVAGRLAGIPTACRLPRLRH